MLTHIEVTTIRETMSGKATNLRTYLKLIEWARNSDVTQDMAFQTKYKGFWRVRGRGGGWCVPYFAFMESHKTVQFAFADVLNNLFETTGKVEGSFASKLLATLYPQQPIWDEIVLRKIGIPQPQKGQKDKQRQIKESLVTYTKLENWYSEYMKTPNAMDIVNLVDEMYPFATIMTSVKKVDWALWSMGA